MLSGHGFFDACPHLYAGPGLAVSLQFADRVRGPLRDFDRLAGVVDRDEDRQTLRRLNGCPVGRVGGVDGDEDVHAGAAGVDQVGVQFDEFTDGDRPVEVDIADVGGDAVATTPPGGRSVGGLVDPLEQPAAVDRADDAGVGGFDEETMDGFVATRPVRVGCCVSGVGE